MSRILHDAFDAALTGVPYDIFGAFLAHWYRDGWTGSSYVDLVNAANSMTAASGRDPSAGTVNGHGTAVFDGTNDIVACSDVNTLAGAEFFTAWGCFKGSPGQVAYATIFGKLYGGVEIHIGANSTGDRLIASVGSNFGLDEATSNADPFDNAWHYYVYVWTAGTGGVLYLDGVAQTDTESTNEVAIPDATEFLSIGGVTTDNSTAFDYLFAGETTNVGAATRDANSTEVDDLSAYLADWLGLTTGFTIAVRGVPSDARVGRAQLTTLATVAPRGAPVDARVGRPTASTLANLALRGARSDGRSGRAQITSLATIAPRGAHAEARLGRATVATVATIAPIGVRARSAASSSALSSTVLLSLRGALADARASAGYITTATSIALVGAPADARAGRAQLSGTNTLAPSGVPVDARVGGASVSTVATLALVGAQVDARSGRLQVAPGPVTVAPVGARVVVRASSGSATTGLIIAVIGVRGEALPGGAAVSSLYTVALRGARGEALASSGIVSTAYTVALRGVRARAVPGPATVAPGAVTVAVRGVRAEALPGGAQVAFFVTLGLSGVPADARVGRGTITAASFLALAGLRAGGRIGAATVVPGAVAVALRGVAARAELGPLVVTQSAGTSFLGLSGIRAEAALGSVVSVTEATIRPGGVPVRNRPSAGRLLASYTLAPIGIPITAAPGSARASAFYTLSPVGVGAEVRVGSARLDGHAFLAPAGVPVHGNVGVSGLLLTTDVILRLAGVGSVGRVGPLLVAFPSLGLFRSGVRACVTFEGAVAPATDFRSRVEAGLLFDGATAAATLFEPHLTPGTLFLNEVDPMKLFVGADAKVFTQLVDAETKAKVNASALSIVVTPPEMSDGTPRPDVTYTLGVDSNITLVAGTTGYYRAVIDCLYAGRWEYRWVSAGPVAKGADRGYFDVLP